MKSNIKKDYFWNICGVLLQNALSPLLIIVVTRVNGIDDSGIFSFAFSIAILFWAIAMWGGRTYQVSDAQKLFAVQSYVLMRVFLAVAILIAAVVFCIISGYDAVKTSVIFALVLMKVIESVADAMYGVMQTNGRLYLAGKSLMYKSIIGILVFSLVDITTQSLIFGCFSLVFVNSAIVILYDIPKVQKLQPISVKKTEIARFTRQALQILKRTASVCIVSFLAAFSLNIPRYFLDMQFPAEIGYFGIIAMPVTLVVLLMTFILQPNIVGLSQRLHKNELDGFGMVVAKIIGITIAVGIAVLIAVFFVGVPALSVVFGLDFTHYKLPLMIITTGAIFSALVAIFINMLTIMRRLKVQVYILLITNGMLVAVSALMQKVGITESVWLFTVTAVAQAALFTGVYLHEIKRLRYEAR